MNLHHTYLAKGQLVRIKGDSRSKVEHVGRFGIVIKVISDHRGLWYKDQPAVMYKVLVGKGVEVLYAGLLEVVDA